MPYIASHDGVRLYFEEAGAGPPLLFVHEFMGDHRSWDAQLRHFSPHYRCIVYNARGYPPSDVPDDPGAYGFEHQSSDILAVLDGLEVTSAHIVGLSMGAFAAFYFAMRWPERAVSVTLAGIGSGSMPSVRAGFRSETEAAARDLLVNGWGKEAQVRSSSPTRVQLENKNPSAFAEFVAMVRDHSAKGSALTLQGYQALRPSLEDFEDQMARCPVPTLIVAGDEDEPCLDASLRLKRHMPSAGLVLLPQTGHACNLEEPEMFNLVCERFFDRVESGQYRMRDPRATPDRML